MADHRWTECCNWVRRVLLSEYRHRHRHRRRCNCDPAPLTGIDYRCTYCNVASHPRLRVTEPERHRQVLAMVGKMQIKADDVREWVRLRSVHEPGTPRPIHWHSAPKFSDR